MIITLKTKKYDTVLKQKHYLLEKLISLNIIQVLTGEEVLPSDLSRMLDETMFTYCFFSGKASETNTLNLRSSLTSTGEN